MCCTRLAGNTGCKDYAKNRHLRTIAQICRAMSLQLRRASTIGKQFLNTNRYVHNMVNFGPLTAEISVGEFGASQQISRGFASSLRYCSDVAHWRPTKPCTCSVVSWADTSSGALGFWWNFSRCKIHFASKSCVLLYWQRTAWHSSSGRQPKFAASYKLYKEWNYGTFAEGATWGLYAAGRSSRWASGYILVSACFSAKWFQRLLFVPLGTYSIRLYILAGMSNVPSIWLARC